MHVAPTATANGWLEVYGARPLSVVPSEQLRIQPIQPTSLGSTPLEQVIAEEMVGDDGGEGCEGGGDGGGGDGGGGAMHFLMTVSQLQSPSHQLAPLFVPSIVPSLSVMGHRAHVSAQCPPHDTGGGDGGDGGEGGEGGGNGGEGGGEGGGGGGCGWNCTTKDLVP